MADQPPAPAPQQRDHLLGNQTYEVLKFVALILLPALGTLWFTIAGILDLPKANEVLGIITAVDTFLGALIGVSTASYNNSAAKFDGTIVATATPQKTVYSLELNTPPEDLKNKQQVLLDVQPGLPPQ